MPLASSERRLHRNPMPGKPWNCEGAGARAATHPQVISRLAAALSDPPAIASAVFVGGLPVVQDEKRLRR